MPTIPGYDLTAADKKAFRKRCYDTLLGYATQQGLGKECLLRDLTPQDMGLSSWSTPIITQPNLASAWINKIVPVTSLIVIYGALQLSFKPGVSEIIFRSGVTVKGKQGIEGCYGGLPILASLQEVLLSPEARAVLNKLTGKDALVSPIFGAPMEAYFSVPYFYRDQDWMRIDLISYQGSSGDYLLLRGFVAEPVGYTLA